MKKIKEIFAVLAKVAETMKQKEEFIMLFLQKLAKLIDVKSLVTLALVAVLCYTTLRGAATSDLFDNSIMLVLGFFFGKNLKTGAPDTGAADKQPAEEQVDDRV